jgi:hypothetical protein
MVILCIDVIMSVIIKISKGTKSLRAGLLDAGAMAVRGSMKNRTAISAHTGAATQNISKRCVIADTEESRMAGCAGWMAALLVKITGTKELRISMEYISNYY